MQENKLVIIAAITGQELAFSFNVFEMVALALAGRIVGVCVQRRPI